MLDSDPLDRPCGSPLAAHELSAFKGRAGRARRCERRVPVTEHYFCVGADVDEQLPRVPAMRPLSQHRGGGVGSDVASDTRSYVERRERQPDA
jgi:hypothetical protein